VTDEQFTEIVERLDRIEAALESLLGMAQAGGGEPADLDTAELMKQQVRGWD
jgi:hypothetical protein